MCNVLPDEEFDADAQAGRPDVEVSSSGFCGQTVWPENPSVSPTQAGRKSHSHPGLLECAATHLLTINNSPLVFWQPVKLSAVF